MVVSGIHFKPTNSLFQPYYTKERKSKYILQKLINVKTLPTERKELALYVVT